MSTGVGVLLPGGASANFFDAGNLYFRQHFPDWYNDSVAFYCFPAIFEPTFRESSDPEASGRKEMERKLKGITEGDIKGQAAEYEIWKTFNKFAPEFETSVFLFRGFKFDQTHGRILNILLSNHYGKETDAELPTFEADYILFDKSGHIIVLETKGGNKLVSGTLKKAKDQTAKCKHLLDRLSELVGGSDEIPVQRFHVFPFVAQHDRDPSVMTGFDLKCFSTWWKTVTDPTKEAVFPLDHQAILEALVCLFAAKGGFAGARRPNKGSAASLALATDKLEAESLKRRDEEINTQKIKPKKPLTKMVVTEENSPFRQDTALVIYNLTPEQLKVFNCKRRCLIIEGVAGSGKTILLKTKSLELAKKGEKVMVVVPYGMVKDYTDLYSRNNCSGMVKLFPNTYDEQPRNLTSHLQKESEGRHLFVDDMQEHLDCETVDKTMIQILNYRLTQELSLNFYTWIVVDFYQDFYFCLHLDRRDDALRACISTTETRYPINEELAENMQADAADKLIMFEKHELCTTLRNCMEIFKLHQKTREAINAANRTSPSEPLADSHLGHCLSGPQVEIHFADIDEKYSFAPEFQHAFVAMLDSVLWKLKQTYEPEDVAILYFECDKRRWTSFLNKQLCLLEHDIDFVNYDDYTITNTEAGNHSLFSPINLTMSMEFAAVVLLLPFDTTIFEYSIKTRRHGTTLQNWYLGTSRARTTLALVGTKESVDYIETAIPGLGATHREHHACTMLHSDSATSRLQDGEVCYCSRNSGGQPIYQLDGSVLEIYVDKTDSTTFDFNSLLEYLIEKRQYCSHKIVVLNLNDNVDHWFHFIDACHHMRINVVNVLAHIMENRCDAFRDYFLHPRRLEPLVVILLLPFWRTTMVNRESWELFRATMRTIPDWIGLRGPETLVLVADLRSDLALIVLSELLQNLICDMRQEVHDEKNLENRDNTIQADIERILDALQDEFLTFQEPMLANPIQDQQVYYNRQ